MPLPRGQLQRALDRRQAALLPARRDADPNSKRDAEDVPLDNKSPSAATFQDDVKGYELSRDRKKLLIRREKDFYVIDAGAKAPRRADEVKGRR